MLRQSELASRKENSAPGLLPVTIKDIKKPTFCGNLRIIADIDETAGFLGGSYFSTIRGVLLTSDMTAKSRPFLRLS